MRKDMEETKKSMEETIRSHKESVQKAASIENSIAVRRGGEVIKTHKCFASIKIDYKHQ